MDISGVLVCKKLLRCRSSGLGTRWMDAKAWDTPSAERENTPTFRRSCGPSWAIACGGNTGQSSSIISIIPTMAF